MNSESVNRENGESRPERTRPKNTSDPQGDRDAEPVRDRDRLEELLQQCTAELARVRADLQQFAYVASHDLQEPLRAVGGFVALLERRYRGKLDATADEYIGFVVEGVRRMQRLIDGLLEYSRVGTRTKAFEPVDCNRAVDEAMANLQAAIRREDARVTRGQLPTLSADRSQWVQLFENLIDNALKFRRDESPRVQISAERADDAWVFSVADNGIGIDPKHADRVFLIFQRLHHRDEYPGIGLGLAICQRIVQRHGGRIWFDSEPAAGTTFRFTIPAGA